MRLEASRIRHRIRESHQPLELGQDLDGIKDEKTLLSSYKPRTRWSVNRARTSGVRVRELGADELGTFVDIERKTAGRRGFTARDEDYYRRFKETFGSRARFMLAEIHANELLAGLTAEHDRLADQLDSLKNQIRSACHDPAQTPD